MHDELLMNNHFTWSLMIFYKIYIRNTGLISYFMHHYCLKSCCYPLWKLQRRGRGRKKNNIEEKRTSPTLNRRHKKAACFKMHDKLLINNHFTWSLVKFYKIYIQIQHQYRTLCSTIPLKVAIIFFERSKEGERQKGKQHWRETNIANSQQKAREAVCFKMRDNPAYGHCWIPT